MEAHIICKPEVYKSLARPVGLSRIYYDAKTNLWDY